MNPSNLTGDVDCSASERVSQSKTKRKDAAYADVTLRAMLHKQYEESRRPTKVLAFSLAACDLLEST